MEKKEGYKKEKRKREDDERGEVVQALKKGGFRDILGLYGLGEINDENGICERDDLDLIFKKKKMMG